LKKILASWERGVCIENLSSCILILILENDGSNYRAIESLAFPIWSQSISLKILRAIPTRLTSISGTLTSHCRHNLFLVNSLNVRSLS
jgi:hypothetical protein